MKKTFIIIIILAVVVIGAYYAIVNKSLKGTSTNTLPETNNSASSSPTPTSASDASESNASETSSVENITVDIRNFSFNPSTLTVKKGTKVTWTNSDNVAHTVTSDSGNLLNSATLSPGQSFSFIFTNPGSINYHCAIHPTMKGKIIIQ